MKGNHMQQRETEQLHPDAEGLDQLPPDCAARLLLSGQRAALSAVEQALPQIARAGRAMAEAITGGGRLIYAAAGSSGLMAMADACELPGTFGIAADRILILMAGGLPRDAAMPGDTEDAVSEAEEVAAVIRAGDAVILISASGTTPYPLAIKRMAEARGACTICIANNPGTPLLAGATVPVCLPTPPEILAGSTRMGAGTAQKATLNMMSTLMGIALGHVHDGMMVNLCADNAKLRRRAAGIVARVANISDDLAQTHLSRCGGDVKTAILLACGAESPNTAGDMLARAGGRLRDALAALPDRS